MLQDFSCHIKKKKKDLKFLAREPRMTREEKEKGAIGTNIHAFFSQV